MYIAIDDKILDEIARSWHDAQILAEIVKDWKQQDEQESELKTTEYEVNDASYQFNNSQLKEIPRESSSKIFLALFFI